ncbi:MAG TPA: prolipoprotein diacylglyceryl transferase family protein [Anaerolineales bacterium]|nr:prolipoprotein diacylglyceryl transferase family protein [Anaerolineales bacterium]
MLPYLRLGPFLLQTSGLALLLGVWLGSWLAEKEAPRVEIMPERVYNLVFFGLIGGLVGARLAYAARFLSAYLENPLSLFALNPNTLAPYPGLLIGLLVAFVYGQRKGLRLRPALDALAPGLAVFMVFLGLAHLLSGDAFGAPSSTLPWRIYLWSEYRHPSQVYEILLALGVLLVFIKRPFGEPGRGLNFLWVVALSAGARVFLEAYRGDSLIWAGGFRAAQVIGLLAMFAALWWMRLWSVRFFPAEREPGMQVEG